MCRVFPLIEQDIAALVINCSDWVKDHPLYRNKPMDAKCIYTKLMNAYALGVLKGITVIDDSGDIQGALLVIKANDLFSDELNLYETLFYVHPFCRSFKLAREMVKAVRLIAINIQAKTLQFGVTSGYEEERMGKLYKYLGFEKRGGTYVMEV